MVIYSIQTKTRFAVRASAKACQWLGLNASFQFSCSVFLKKISAPSRGSVTPFASIAAGKWHPLFSNPTGCACGRVNARTYSRYAAVRRGPRPRRMESARRQPSRVSFRDSKGGFCGGGWGFSWTCTERGKLLIFFIYKHSTERLGVWRCSLRAPGQTGGRQKLCFSFIPTDYLNGQYGYDITHLRISIGLGRFPYSKRYSISFIPSASNQHCGDNDTSDSSSVCTIYIRWRRVRCHSRGTPLTGTCFFCFFWPENQFTIIRVLLDWG